jgi:hypothetical protein
MKNPSNQRRLVQYPSDCIELPPFIEWFEASVRSHHFETECDRSLLTSYSVPPSLKTTIYRACKAYGNHWRTIPSLNSLIDCDSSGFKTFDSGMACTFIEKRVNWAGIIVDESVQYVGVLTQILVLNYGGLRKDIVLFKGRWVYS